MTSPIIDRKKRIKRFIESLQETNNNNSLTPQQKHVKFARLCTNERRFLGAGQSREQAKQDDNPVTYKIAPSTYLSYLTDYRNAIRAMNEVNLLARKKITDLQNDYTDIDLSGLNKDLPELRQNLKKILKRKEVMRNVALLKKLDRLRIEHHAFYCMRPDSNVLDSVHKDNRENLYKKHTTQKTVSPERIEQTLSILAKSSHWVDLTVLIALATGRRSIEVLKVGSFAVDKKDFVLFEGQAKTKTRDDLGRFSIPCLISNTALIKKHEQLKQMISHRIYYDKPFGDLTNDQVNGATAHRLNNAVKKIFGDEFTFKDLRAMYAKKASIKHHHKKEKTLAAFYSEILGHDDKDIATQLSYQGIVFDDEQDKEKILEPIELTTDKPKIKIEGQKSVKALAKFDEVILQQKSAAVKRIHVFTKSALEEGEDVVITQSFLTKKGGFSRPAIKTYLALVGIGVRQPQ